MYESILNKIEKELSGQMALKNVAAIAQYHRIPGYRGQCDAAKKCEEIMRVNGIDAQAVEYPADGETMFWSEQTPEGWQCNHAELWITYPETEKKCIANFEEMEISLMQQSGPTPPGGIETELVVINNPEDEASYKDLEINGKMVLVGSCNMNRAHQLAVEKFGAIGIVTDRISEWAPVRERMDVPDVVHWNGFHWTGHEKKCFGFAISPRTGDMLRKLKGVKLYANVESTFKNSSFMNVEALIQGESDEEIVVIAHLCHPKPSANDNASGSGTVMEVARTLNKLINKGELPKPKRSIRFLLVPEFLGTYAYLSKHEAKVDKMLAGINLDMVGENQDLCKSVIQVERPPLSAPGYVGDLLETVFKAISDEATNFFGTAKFPLFKYSVNQFSGGSDHYILSDPTINIPCPMIGSWPDLYYHTSQDSIDKVDPKMLKRVGTATAVYSYFLANAGYEEAVWLSGKIASKFGHEVDEIIKAFEDNRKEKSSTLKVKDVVKFRLSLRTRDLKELEKYVPEEKNEAFKKLTDKLSEHMKDVSKSQLKINNLVSEINSSSDPDVENNESQQKELEDRAKNITPMRKYPAPVPLGLQGHLHLLSEEERDEWREFLKVHKDGPKIDSLLMYWADGSRNVYDIANLVEMEIGCNDLEFAIKYFSILEKLELVNLNIS